MNALFSPAPKAGRSLEGLVAPMRERVSVAVAAAALNLATPFAWLIDASAKDLIYEQDWVARSAWAAVAITIIEAATTGELPSVRRALDWFDVHCDADWAATDAALAPLGGHSDLLPLMPYLLDTYGRTTRLDVMRDDGLRSARDARKRNGSFYTPADVVTFMVNSIASPQNTASYTYEHWLDPACGSGVFLAEALRRREADGLDAQRTFAMQRLHGSDISPQACDFASFTILSLVTGGGSSPLATWRAIRSNFVALDATRHSADANGESLRAMLGLGKAPLRLICNPPYVSGGSSTSLGDGFPTRSLYLPFVEMAWRVANGEADAASIVVPLALGANRSADHRRCRTAMAQAGGTWTLLFFDRQPHALFGEEAKTRATIAIRRPGPKPAEIRTSGLLKWTSRQRAAIFSEARATSMGQANIGRIVPKLGSEQEATLYQAFDAFRLCSGMRPKPSSATAQDIVGTKLTADVFVAGTAYNFLNIFRNYPDKLSWRGTLSASGIHRLGCDSIEAADAVNAILVSRLAFWFWHVECDGFHVPAWFLSELPLLNIPLDASATVRLAQLGREAWAGLQRDIHCSTNRDRLTFAFRPTEIGAVRAEIDRVLLTLIGVDPAQSDMLERFEKRVVSIDGSIRRARPRNSIGEEE